MNPRGYFTTLDSMVGIPQHFLTTFGSANRRVQREYRYVILPVDHLYAWLSVLLYSAKAKVVFLHKTVFLFFQWLKFLRRESL